MNAAWVSHGSSAVTGDEENEALRQQLHACAEFCALVAEQLRTADGGDGTGATGLQLRRDRAEVERAVRGPNAEPDEFGRSDIAAEVTRVLQAALDVLDGRSEDEQRMRDWIGALQDASLPLMRGLVARTGRWAEVG